MALQNFVDKVGPAISAAWLNAVDYIKQVVTADAAGNLTLTPTSLTIFSDMTLQNNKFFKGTNTTATTFPLIGINASNVLTVGSNIQQSTTTGQWTVNGSAAGDLFTFNGFAGSAMTIQLKDGQAGTRQWRYGVGSTAAGVFSIDDITGARTPFKIDTAGNITFSGNLNAVNGVFSGPVSATAISGTTGTFTGKLNLNGAPTIQVAGVDQLAYTGGQWVATGAIKSAATGFVFPDGTTQATAATGAGQGITAGTGATGYSNFSTVMQMRFGTSASIPATSSATVNFANAFPTACVIVIATAKTAGGTSQAHDNTSGYTTSGFTMTNAASVASTFDYIAIGY
jgi:hypothetical protein